MAPLSAKDKDVSSIASSLELNASVPNSTKRWALPCPRAKHEDLREAQSWISCGYQPD